MYGAEKTCVCPYGDRCAALAYGFAKECGEIVAAARGGYVEIPPPGMDHLLPSLTFNVRLSPGGANGSSPGQDTAKKLKAMSPWEQIRRAYAHYFHVLLNEERVEEDDLSESVANGLDLHDDNDIYVDVATPERLYVALHHFHPKITALMRKGQQPWDHSLVWQCLHSSSLSVLLNGEDSDMERQIAHKSNRVKMDDRNQGSGMNYDFPSYVVLPNYPIERSERDHERLKAVYDYTKPVGTKEDTPEGENTSNESNSALTPRAAESEPEVRVEGIPSDANDGRRGGYQRQSSGRSMSELSSHSRMSRTEWREHRDNYHEKLLLFERTRRAAADERLQSLQADWHPHYLRLKDIVLELRRIDILVRSSCGAMNKYTQTLQSWTIPDDILAGLNSPQGTVEILDPLIVAFSSIAADWQEDMPHLNACYETFENLRNQAEAAIEDIQGRYSQLQHEAVADEIAIRQTWSDLEELCIIDTVMQHRKGAIGDRWLRELAYRRWIVTEKTNTRKILQPILDSVVELDKYCQTRIQEVLLTFLPKHRRLFLQTREKFDPTMDALEAGAQSQEEVEKAVALEVALSDGEEKEDEETPPEVVQQHSFLSSVFGSSQKGPVNPKEVKQKELTSEMTKLGALLRSVHIYEVQIVSFRVEQNTWVTSFCVTTYQQYMHFFPLLPGTNFESLRKEAQSQLADACISAWEKGSTPLLSVLLTSCSYGLSADRSFIELIIATPPRKKIGLRVGSPEECEQWVHKTQQWVMMFSMK